MRQILAALAVSLPLALAAHTARAEQAQDFGEHVVHFNAVTTDFLSPEVAKSYGIRRSRTRGLLTVSVMRRLVAGATKPVPAQVEARAVNLSGQLKRIRMREIREEGAIYYIGEFPLSGSETLDFEIEVRPQGVGHPYKVRFRQRFYVP